MRTLPYRLPLALAALLSACSSAGRALDASQVPAALETARVELAEGETEQALDRLRAASKAVGLPSETREAVQRALEETATKRIDELSQPGADPDDLADLLDLELPRQIVVTAGLRAARAMFAAGDAVDAYEVLRKLDRKVPSHHERFTAGELLIEIGLWLVPNGRGWFGLGHSTDDAQEVLEYVILHHPAALRCDEALATLALLYEDDREWSFAIERWELLVLNHPNSRLRSKARAKIPHLRLIALRSPEYDRNELLKAQRELESWLAEFAGLEGERQVRVDLGDCLRRLADSDLGIARFYATVGNEYGTRHHASRALETARTAADEGRMREARELIPAAKEASAPAGAQP